MLLPSKKILSTLLFLLLVILVFLMIYSVSFLRKITVFNQVNNDTPAGEIYAETQVGQTFLAEGDGLSSIVLLMATYNRENSGEIVFHLKRSAHHRRDLFLTRIDIREFKDNRYFPFRFPKIENSKGRKFYFYLEAPESQPGNAITAWSLSKDTYREGEKIVNGAISEGDLTFMTTYEAGLEKNLGLFLERITQNKPSPLNWRAFYTILVLLFIVCSSLFITGVARFFMEHPSDSSEARIFQE